MNRVLFKRKESGSGRKLMRPIDIALALVIAAASIAVLFANVNNGSGKLTAVVRKNSSEICRIDLSEVEAPYSTCVDEEFHVIIYVEHDRVTVTHSDCDDKICVNTGTLDSVGQTAVCLPAKVSVEIVGEKQDELDGVIG